MMKLTLRRVGFMSVVFASLVWVASNAQAETLAWYHFDDTVGTIRGEGYEYPNAVNDTKYPARLRKFYQSWGGAFMPLMVTNFLAAPCHIYRDGVNGTPVVNVSALSHMYDPVGSDDKGGGIIAITEGVEDRALHFQHGTVECFLKTTASGHWVSLISRQSITYGDSFNLYTEGSNIKLAYYYVENGEVLKHDFELSNAAYNLIKDGLWHHLAFTLDEVTHQFELFVDYRKVGVATLKGPIYYEDGAFWCFGGKGNGGWRSGGAWDEIRFSDEILPRKSMLRFGNTAPDGTTLLHYSFEGNCNPSVGSSTIFNEAEASADFAAGKLAYVPLKSSAVEDGLENVLLSVNTSALYMNEGVMIFALSNLNLRCYQSMTIEFFMKADDAVEPKIPVWGSLMTMSNPIDWVAESLFKVQRNGKNSLFFVMDNPTEEGGSINSSLDNLTIDNLYDGAWHHVALTIKPGEWKGNPTEDSTLYIDYVKAKDGTKSQMGTAAAPANLQLRLGNKTVPWNVPNFYVDEFRVTSGVLPIERFQRMVPMRGTVLILR